MKVGSGTAGGPIIEFQLFVSIVQFMEAEVLAYPKTLLWSSFFFYLLNSLEQLSVRDF